MHTRKISNNKNKRKNSRNSRNSRKNNRTKIYKKENPFDFMKSFGLDGKSNFFETRPSEYIHASTAKATGDDSWDFGN